MLDQKVQITEIILTTEDLAAFDQVLGNFAFRLVSPLYKIFEQRMEEAANRVVEQQKSNQEAISQTQV